MKKILKKIIRYINSLDTRKPKVATIQETVDYICDNRCSVSRIGDGEFKWIYGFKQNSFEKQSKELSNRLKEVVKKEIPNHIVCIPEGTYRLDIYTDEARQWWDNFGAKYRILWNNMLNLKRQYFNLHISRPYLDFKDKIESESRFNYVKKIWDKRPLLIVEGEKTRLGVGNDLFDNATRIRRILCPPKNAFSKYQGIFDSTRKIVGDDDLVLIALGPTATVLAYDLANEGIQAIDIGHIDVEYEWFRMGATSKMPVKGKYVNEATNQGGDKPDDSIIDNDYLAQIICTIA